MKTKETKKYSQHSRNCFSRSNTAFKKPWKPRDEAWLREINTNLFAISRVNLMKFMTASSILHRSRFIKNIIQLPNLSLLSSSLFLYRQYFGPTADFNTITELFPLTPLVQRSGSCDGSPVSNTQLCHNYVNMSTLHGAGPTFNFQFGGKASI